MNYCNRRLFLPLEDDGLTVDDNFGKRGSDNAVKKVFDSGKIDARGATIVRVIYAISANSEALAVGIIFFWSEVYHNATIGNVTPAVFRNILFVDEKNCVCSGDLTWHALSDPSNLFGVKVSV